MTREDKREKEINDAIETYMNGLFEDGVEITIEDYENIEDDFEAGTEWADEHPKSPWISVDDDLPCNHEDLMEWLCDTTNVLVTGLTNKSGKRFRYISHMTKNGNASGRWFWSYPYEPYEITHWMPIPPLSKE